jgi:hypothetical protein
VSAEPFAEAPQPSGEHGLVGGVLVAVTLVARVVGHAFDARDFSVTSRRVRRPRSRADHTHWVWASQESVFSIKCLKE